MKVLIATEKPFAPVAVKDIKGILEKNGMEVACSKNMLRKLNCLLRWLMLTQ